MASMIIWSLGIGISVAILVVTAAIKHYYIHMLVAAMISILLALAAFAEERSATRDADRKAATASIGLRYMGIVWGWGALGLLVTYAFDILAWREWWQFFLIFFVLAGLSLFLAATMQKDADANRTDAVMFDVVRGFSIFIFVAMLITMAGLLIDGKMWRFTTEAGQRYGSQDWAANNIFFFGALALAAISLNTLSHIGWRKPQAS
ncbi:MAG: hypothetical protein ACK5JT_09545 [Hyphomicrobiaceae bacterium]